MSGFIGVSLDICIPSDHHPSRIINADKDFPRELNFKTIKVRDIHKIRKRNFLVLVILVWETSKTIQRLSQQIFSKYILIY